MIPRMYLVKVAPWWVLCLIVGSFLPGSVKNELGTTTPMRRAVEGQVATKHRVVHFIAFGSTALILILIGETPRRRMAGALGVAALGFTLECAQYHFLHLPFMEWWDVRDDLLASSGALAMVQWKALRREIVNDSR